MVVIRRETGLSARIRLVGLPPRRPRGFSCSCAARSPPPWRASFVVWLGCDTPRGPRRRFRRGANGPDEAQEFAPDGRRRPVVYFSRAPSGCDSAGATGAVPPRDRVDLVTGALLALEERPPAGGPVPVRPGRFNHDPSQMGIALGDPAAACPGAAGVSGHRAALAHQLRGPTKAPSTWPSSATIVAADTCAIPRRACSASITTRIGAGAVCTASSEA